MSANEPPTVTWAAYWATLAAVVSVGLGVAAPRLGVPTVMILFVAAAAAFAVRVVAARVVWVSELFAHLSLDLRAQVLALITAAAALHLGWIVALVISPDWWAWGLLALVVLGLLEYVVARSHRLLLTGPPPALVAYRDANAAQYGADPPLHREALHAAALRRAGHGGFTVTGVAPIEHGVQAFVQAQLGAGGKGRAAVTLAASDAEAIAVALMWCVREADGGDPGFTLDSDWVRIRKERGAGAYSVMAVTEDVQGKVRPFTDAADWTSIKVPVHVGWELDGRPGTLLLRQHGRVMGKSRMGKSALIHVGLAHITRCRDALAWICGTEKLYDFLAGWIEPYDGTDERLPFDWIRSGPRGVLDMLIGAMNLARWRQRQPMAQRGQWPTIVLVLDEASFALRNQDVTGVYQGQVVTAARMAAMIMQGAGSADIWLVLASQRSTQDHFGPHGGDTVTNAGWSAAFATEDQQEVGRMMGDYQLPTPTRPGQFWLKTGTGDPLVQLMAPYLQTTDPTQPVLHNGLTVSDVAWSRRVFRRTGCMADAGPAEVIGGGYAGRHTRMGPELRDYLTGADTVTSDPEPVVTGVPMDDPEAVIRLMAAEEAAATGHPPPAAAPAPTTSLATILGRKPRPERIGEILLDATKPMSPAEILAELHARGDTAATEQVVYNALRQLVNRGLATRMEQGQYVLAGRDAELTNTPEMAGVAPDSPAHALAGARGEAVSESG